MRCAPESTRFGRRPGFALRRLREQGCRQTAPLPCPLRRAGATGCRQRRLEDGWVARGTNPVRKTMRLMRSVVAGCALLFSIDALAPVQSDLTGYWKYAVPNGGVS